MSNLRNIKKAPFEIGRLLAANKTLCGYMLDDSDTPAPTEITFENLLNEKYVTIYPPVDEGHMDNYDRNTYLVILLDSINPNGMDENTLVNGTIYVVTDIEHILLTGNRNRLLEMVDEVYRTLNNVKLTSAGQIVVGNIYHTMITPFKAGYRINFSFSDQQYVKAEI